MDETAAVLTTLVLYLPIGLLTLLQVAEAGRRGYSRSASEEPSPPPDTPVTNRNPRREAWEQTHRPCASLSWL
jgi:hypothetical protein